MNVDEAMEIAEQLSGGSLNFRHHSNLRALAIGALYNEVNRLRAELAAAKAEIESVIRLGPHPVEQVQMSLATFIKTRFVPVWEYNELEDKLERTQTELAAAKAASVVPVEESREAFNQWNVDGLDDFLGLAFRCSWNAAIEWVRNRNKDNPPPAT